MTPIATAELISLASTRAVGDAVSDAHLVAAVRTGDDRAFERLYERYHRRITSYVYGMVSDHGRAEDIVQDVFMSALRRMRETDREIAVKPWLYEIAKNACIDQFRRSRRTQEVSFDADEDLGAADAGRLVSTSATPDAAVDQKLAMDDLRGAFGGLSDTHHQILVMRELEGLSYREIGERLDMRRPSVESTLHRARRRLAQEYAELISGERCRRVQAVVAGTAAPSPGARDQRRMAAHLSHCQPCRRAAHAAGFEAGVHRRKSARARIAAPLPWPAFLRRRVDHGDDVGAVASTHAPALSQWSSHAAVAMDPALVNAVKAGAAAATLALIGIGSATGPQGPVPQKTDRAEPAISAGRTAPLRAAPASSRGRAPTPAVVKKVTVPAAKTAAPAAGPGGAVTGATPTGATALAPSSADDPSAAGGTGPPAPPSTPSLPSALVAPVKIPGLPARGVPGGAGRVPVLGAPDPAPAEAVEDPVVASAPAALEPVAATQVPATGEPLTVAAPTALPVGGGAGSVTTSTARSTGPTVDGP